MPLRVEMGTLVFLLMNQLDDGVCIAALVLDQLMGQGLHHS